MSRTIRQSGAPAIAAILFVALGVRLFFVFLAGDRCVADEESYVRIGRGLADGTGRLTAFYPPLYLFFLAAVFRVFGPGLLAPRIAQAFLGVATTYLVFRLGKEVGGRRSGLVAALLFAVFPEVAGFASLYYTENLFLPFFVAALVVFLSLLRRPSSYAQSCLAGVCFGLGVLTREVVLFFAFGAAIFLWLAPASNTQVRLRRVFAYLLPLCLLVGGWMSVNYTIHGRFVLTTNRWKMLFEGNHEPADYPVHVALWQRDEFAGEAFARDKAIEKIRKEQPLWFFRKVADSMSRMWTPKDFVTREMSFDGATHARMLAVFVPSTLVLAALLVAGVLGICAAPRNRGRTFLASLVLFLLLVHVVTTAVSRHRLPLIPVLAAYAGCFLVLVFENRARLRRLARPVRAIVAVGSIAGIVAVWSIAFARWSQQPIAGELPRIESASGASSGKLRDASTARSN
jgi:4-amino-4-deoxy-L-arabinose transferase-like glycosyltransferase